MRYDKFAHSSKYSATIVPGLNLADETISGLPTRTNLNLNLSPPTHSHFPLLAYHGC